MKVAPVDLIAEYEEIKTDVLASLKRVVENARFILGEEVARFEKNFSAFIGSQHAIGVNSGTDALLLSLMAGGIRRGDEVITTALTYAATATAIARTGAKPVFIDIDPDTYNLNVRLIEKAITNRTKAIVPVHLYGLPCDMTTIMDIARKRRLIVVEDCAQACGATWKGRLVGSFGDFGAFSFYPSKTIGAYGDGGMITTSQKRFDESVRSYRNQGDPHREYLYRVIGMNSRLDAMQAAILDIKLKQLNLWNKKREEAALRYNLLIGKSKIRQVAAPKRFPETKHVFHQYTIRTSQRDALLQFLLKNDIAANIYYPHPLHLQPCFRELQYKKGSLLETERAAKEILSLPLFPQIKPEQQKFVVGKIQEFFRK